MIIKTFLLFVALPILLTTTVSAGNKRVSGEMIIDGSWHGDEVVA